MFNQAIAAQKLSKNYMQNLFLFFSIFILFILIQSVNALDEIENGQSLCPKPETKVNDHLSSSPQYLHEYMLKAKKSALKGDWTEKTLHYCSGFYVNPFNPNPQKTMDVQQSNLYLSAENANYQNQSNLYLTGSVEAYKGPLRLSADEMEYNEKSGQGKLSGDINIRAPQLLLKAPSGNINLNTQAAEINSAEYFIHQINIRGNAEKLALQTNQNKMTMTKASFTSCPPEEKDWSLNAKKIKLDNEVGWGEAHHATLKIEDIPVFYFPYLTFPLDERRKTGFLFPNPQVSGNNLDLATPYYINIAPQADMTYTPRLQTAHGLSHSLESRYLNQFSLWQLNLQYIYHDKKIGDENIKINKPDDRERWAIGLKESGRLSQNWSTYINFQQVSDNDFFKDWGSQGLDITKTLNIRRDLGINYRNSRWHVKATVIDYQSLEENPDVKLNYRQLPNIQFQYFPVSDTFKLNPVLLGEYVFFQDKKGQLEAHRSFLNPGVSINFNKPAIDLETQLVLKRTDYEIDGKSNQVEPINLSGHESIIVPSFSIDSSIFLERQSKLWLQTLTPRFFYYYAKSVNQTHLPNFDTTTSTFSWQQLFRGERFSGHDRISDANQLSLAFTSSFITQNSGKLIADMGIGQIAYFKDRTVSLYANERSLLIIPENATDAEKRYIESINEDREMRYYRDFSYLTGFTNWYFTPRQKINLNWQINPYSNQFKEGTFRYQFLHNNDKILNIAYRYVKNQPEWVQANQAKPKLFETDIHEGDFSTIWPLSSHWSALYRLQYDFNRNELADHIIGLSYNNCCLNVKLAYQKERRTYDPTEWVSPNFRAGYKDRYMLEITFKGLGSINSSINKLMTEKIPGFIEKP